MKGKKDLAIGLEYKNKKIFLKVKRCNYLDEIFGLMFKKRESANALLFDFTGKRKLALHSFFVFFPFLALWLDDKDRILELKIVEPFSASIFSKEPFSKIIEVPINFKYKKIIKKLVDERKI